MLRKRQISVVWIRDAAGDVYRQAARRRCRRRRRPPPPPVEQPAPPPPPKAPVIGEFTAEPSSIERGQSSTLRWSVTGATSVSIDQGIGTVQANGSRRVFPSDTTTYDADRERSGRDGDPQRDGERDGAAAASAARRRRPRRRSSSGCRPTCPDAYFDYDKSDIREDARATLTKNADALKAILADFPNAAIVMEGHCDERGSAEYNLGLGDRRATSAKEFLVQLGVAERQAADHQLRQGAPAVHGGQRRLLAEEPPRALLHGAVES